MTVSPPPTVPTGTVTHRYLGVSADGSDTDTAPDLIHLRAVTGVITPSTPRLIHTSGSTEVTLERLPVEISYDASGNLQYLDPETGELQSGPLRLPANDDSVAPTITYEVAWSIPGLGRRWSGSFTLNAGETVDLSTVGLASAVPNSSALFVDLLEAARELEGVVETVETARDEAVAARDVAVPAADRAEQARDATLTAATWTLTGPGRPDQPATTGGIIAGSEPVGTAYISTDGAGVGAWAWRKRPSGWEVTDGDTGWRSVETPIGTVRLSRQGATVLLQGTSLRGELPSSGTLLTLPSGFRPDITQYQFNAIGVDRVTMAIVQFDLTSSVVSRQAITDDMRVQIRLSWSPDPAWPTSLPGS